MVQRNRSQQLLVLALLAFAAVLAVTMLVASRGSIAQRTTLEQRVARVMQLDEEEAPAEEGAEGEEGEEGEEEPVLPEQLRTYLKVSADSIGYSCGGKEVADVCLMGAETCVASMQKKNRYTVSQSVARCSSSSIAHPRGSRLRGGQEAGVVGGAARAGDLTCELDAGIWARAAASWTTGARAGATPP